MKADDDDSATEAARAVRHRDRMRHKKAVIDHGIERATQERGVVVVHSGNGKGKSSAGFGMVARALGHGMRVGVLQFIKGRHSTGEEAFFRRFPEVSYCVMGDGYTWETQDRDRDIQTARSAWTTAVQWLEDPAYDMVLLDELNIVLKHRYLALEEVLRTLGGRPPAQHVIITGRGAPGELIAFADTVTEMREVKHAYRAGIRAQKGIEL